MARLAKIRRRETSTPPKWCILRTSARSTVALLDELEQAGFTVWTPVEVVVRRMGKHRIPGERCSPMLPSFVFAAEADAANLLRLSVSPERTCPPFTVFLHRDKIPFIADDSLKALRDSESGIAELRARRLESQRRAAEQAEQRKGRAAMRRHAEPMPLGAEVQVPGSAFVGAAGIVIESSSSSTVVRLGLIELKVDTFLLRSDILDNA